VKRLGLTFGLVLLLFALGAAAGMAQTPDKKREFVYGIQAFSGLAYEGIFYPLTEDTIYLLADVSNIISPRYSLVYFWPVTNEYKADFDALSEPAGGTVEILQGGQVVQSLPQSKYLIQYPNGLDTGEVYVFFDEEAELQYQEFERRKQAYRDSVAAYYEASIQYRQDAQEKVSSGELREALPPPPPEPAPFTFFSTAVYDGYHLKLPAGTYSIRLKGADGQILPESQRTLIMFTEQRQGISYTLVPQDKWTIPEQSHDPSQTLYARSGTVIYLQPFDEKEYNELYYSRLKAPQSTNGRISHWQWAPSQSTQAAYLEIVYNGQVVEKIEQKPYIVKQTTGKALGYEILEQAQATTERDQTRTPDLVGYRVQVGPDQPAFTVRLVNSDGQVIPGSEREIRLLNPQYTRWLYFLPVIPLLLGFALALWRASRLARMSKYGEAVV
jgi:hypothetical protein